MKKTSPAAQAAASTTKPTLPRLRRKTGLMALEQRFMFDGAAASELVDVALPHALPVVEAVRPMSENRTDVVVAPAEQHELGHSEPVSVRVSGGLELLTDVGQTRLQDALKQLQTQLTSLAQREDFDALIQAVFGQGRVADSDFSARVKELQTALQAHNISVDVQLVTDVQMQGAQGAYSPAHDGQPERIYINADWLNQGGRTDWAAQVLLEELGHALDVRLNGQNDTAGDEGQRFALAVSATAQELDTVLANRAQDNDHGRLTLEGREVDVEFAIAPDVSLFFADGYLGTQASSTNKANSIKTLATLGVTRAAFVQTDVNGDGLFGDGGGTQGNDLAGSLRLYLSNGTKITLTGALNWRETTGSNVEVFGFIFDAGQNASISYGNGLTYNIVGGSTTNTSTNLGLKAYNSTFTFVDGENRAGNAATSGLLDSLNNYLLASPRPNTISLSAGSVLEGQNLVYTVNMSAAPTVMLTYALSVTGTATSTADFGTNYVFSNGVTSNGDGTVNVPVGVTSFTVTIPTIVDALDDPNESVILTVGQATATGYIADPLRVSSVVVNEASPYAVFEVTGSSGQTASLAFANGSTNPATGGGTDYGSVVQVSSDGGLNWSNYTSGNVLLNSAGKLLVRTAIVNDNVADNSETFKLTASDAGGGASIGTGTIKDDGTGIIFKSDGTNDTTAVRDDDRALAVNSITVNEASPYAVFEVTGAVDQLTKLALATGNAPLATGGGTDYSSATGSGLQYLVGSTWTDYTVNANVSLGATGKLLVRTAIVNDSFADNSETFKLNATNTGGSTASGLATIKDDGTGTIFKNDGTDDTTAVRDDDRALAVNSITVNEASPYAVFEVTGAVDQLTKLALVTGNAPLATGGGTDYSSATGSGLQYLLGSTWTDYTANANVSLGATGKLLVRTAIVNDSVADNSETFKLNATNISGSTAFGLATIKDDGTGTIFKNDGTDDTTALRDDDRALSVNSITVNEASPYAVFEVSGAANQLAQLALAASGTTPAATGAGTDYSAASGTGLQYLVGSTWTTYTANAYVALGATGKLLVRTAIVNDTVADNNETFKLQATNTAGAAASGVATIKDDGTGDIFKDDGTTDLTATKDDDRALAINNITVNEASPYAVFEVSGAANQLTTLALAAGTTSPASGGGVDYGMASGSGLEYWTGSSWSTYTSGRVSLNGSGVLLVRTPIINDSPLDGGETFKLTATNTGGVTATGVATITDDGTGNIYAPDGTLDTSTPKDDDAYVALPSVNSITVNEASPYAVLQVSGQLGQMVTLNLVAGSAAANVDYSASMEYSSNGGTSWAAYTGTAVALNGTGGTLLVRVPVLPDTPNEPDEDFVLKVTTTANTFSTGTVTIVDDANGTIFNNTTGAEDTTTVKDDDRVIAITSPVVNEGSPSALFVLTGAPGQDGFIYDGGTLIHSFTFGTSGSYGFFYSYTSEQETAVDGPESKTLTVKTQSGTASTGTATLRDDGTGSYWVSGNATPLTAAQLVAADVALDDDRALTVNSFSVNEASPYAVFDVSGAAGQRLSLALTLGSTNPATGAGTDYSQSSGAALQYFDGVQWVNYTPGTAGTGAGTNKYTGTVTLDASGHLMVRTRIVNDAVSDNAETFKLQATNTGGSTAEGVATIKDDGTGTIFKDDGMNDANALRDDDRAVTVTGTTVNEASSHVVFTVTGLGGQLVQLSLTESGSGNGHALLGTDTGLASQLEYLDGSTWKSYTGGYVTLPGSGAASLLVRVAVKNDTLNEGAETLKLIASTTGVSSNGLSTIKDDGTGDKVTFDGTSGLPSYTSGPGSTFDDDRPLTIADITVAESGGYAVFDVNAFGGQYVKLALTAGSATVTADFGPALEYKNSSNQWVAYTPGDLITVPGTAGQASILQVRTAIARDSLEELTEQFRLVATNTGGTEGRGTASITDNAKPALTADTAVAVEQGGVNNATTGHDPAGNFVAGSLVSGNTGTGGLDSDADGDTLTVTSVANTAVSATAVATGGSAVSVPGVYGVLSVTPSGGYTYTVNNSHVDVQGLRTTSNTLTETFTYTVADGYGGVSSSTLTVFIRGSNDAPVAVADYGVAKESLTGGGITPYSTTPGATYDPLGYKATGSVLPNDTDVDSGDTKTVRDAKASLDTNVTAVTSGGVTLTGTHGTLLIHADGSYTYTPTVNSTLLSEGESGNDVFVYTLQDTAGVTSTANLTITVYGSGTNDPDAVDDANSVAEAGGSTSAVTATGNVLGGSGVSAGDKADTTPAGTSGPVVVSGARSGSANASTLTAVSTSTVINGQYGVLTISSTGEYSYALTNSLADVQALNANETLTERFTYQVKNGMAANGVDLTDSATLTITITGTNDAPTLDLDTSGASSNFAATFTEGGQAVSLSTAAGVNLADVDSTSFANVTVTISQAQVLDGSSEELFVRGATAGGTLGLGSFTPASGSVTLDGLVYTYERSAGAGNLSFVFKGPGGAALTTAQAESLLDALTYQNTSENPTVSGSRVFTLSVTDSGTLTSNSATSTISVVAVNDAPVLDLDADNSSTATGANYRTNYSIGGAAVALADVDRLVTDVDDTHMESATLVLTNAQSGDVLTAGTMPTGITATVGTITSGQITVTLNGSALKADYEAAIRAITFNTTSANLTARDVQVRVSDGALSSNWSTTTIVMSPDNRPLTVAGTAVNEKSPFVVFSVGGAANQMVSLQLESTGSTAGHATLSVDTANANSTFVLQYLSGSTWTNYTPGDAVALDNAGNLLVRTAVTNDAISEGVESLQLIARNGAGTANATPGLSTIRDDGQGGYFADGNTTTTSNVPSGLVLDDDRALTVNSITVNEASPYAVFEVTGAANQLTQLALATGTATANGVDYANNTSTVLQYLVGSTWTNYTASDNVSLGATGKLLVRTAIINDTTLDNNETFKLQATNTGGSHALGLATIKDDGTGDVFRDDGSVNPNAIKDDDRAIAVNDITVNEASPYAVFEVSGFAGQKTSLELLAGSASGGGVDYSAANGSGLQYLSGSSWVAYTSGSFVALDGAGKLLVRTAVTNDSVSDNGETFSLKVSATGGSTDTGVATIKDDGTGTIYGSDGQVDDAAVKDDDRPLTVSSPTVNEASPFAVFTVGGAADQWVDLSLAVGSASAAADYTVSMQVSTNGGLTWTDYEPGMRLNGSGSMLVRVPVLQDSVNEPDETFGLTARNAGGHVVQGTATIVDDGNGTLFNSDGTENSSDPKDDDRGFSVSSPVVNEASPFAVFLIEGSANQALTGLTMQANTATSLDFGDTLQVSADGGANWTPYSSGALSLNATGQLLVRTPIKPDAFVDNNETFSLTATSTTRSAAGTATIKDDGTGAIFDDNGHDNLSAIRDNDHPSVTGTDVNEASPYVMWTVSNVVEGQSVKLTLRQTTAVNDNDAELVLTGAEPADVGPSLEYWNGTAWTVYQPGLNGGFVTVPGDGDSTPGEAAALKVRLAVINDVGLPVLEGRETLELMAEVPSGQSGVATSSIVDDGTGARFEFDGNNDADPTVSNGPGAGFDDDRSLIVYDTTVNEGSPYAVFRVAAVPGMRLILELSNGTANAKTGTGVSALDGTQDFGPAMQYFDGLAWVDYTPNSVYVVPTGSRITLVRTPVINDTAYEGRETFVLTARTESGDISDAGTGEIVDDGTSVIFNESGAEDRFAVKNDDRSLRVNSIEINEGSSYGIFTVNGTAGLSVELALANTQTTLDVDAALGGIDRDTADLAASVTMQYTLDGGVNWVNYSGTAFAIPSVGQFFVRVGVANDVRKEGAETFQLVVTKVSDSSQAAGLALILDDGTGKKFPGTFTAGVPDTNTTDLDDDFDKDGVAPTVEEILATMAASVGWNDARLGDLNGDGLQDAEQNALATLAWTTVDKYQAAIDGTLTSIRPIISLAVMPGSTDTSVSTVAQLENIKVLSPTDVAVGGSKPTGPNIQAPWDPIQFSIAQQPGVVDTNLLDVNSSRAGLQVRVLIDVSASQMPADSFNAYMKYVSAEAFAALPTGTLDNAGTPITGAGWYDFTQRVAGGDGARFILSSDNQTLSAIELIITDNAFGDNNLTVGMVTDPGLPVKITVPEPVVSPPPAPPVEPTPVIPPLSVSSVNVNEASPYAVFTVSGQAGQVTTLSLSTGSAGTADFGPGLEVFNGTQWVAYTGQSVSLNPSGHLLVRTPLVNDAVYEGIESFSLTASNSARVASTGVGSIRDDGAGDIYKSDGTLDLFTVKDDDRPLAVSSPVVNEASVYAVFTVSGKAGQGAVLSVASGTAGSADYGPGLEVFNGTTWVPYTGQVVLLDSNGRLQVRTPVLNDSQFEGPETFSLIARNTGGQQATGVATIRDDGAGDIYKSDGMLDLLAVKDDDRPLAVSSPVVNEASAYAVFTVSGKAGQGATLSVANGTAGSADYGPGLEVFNGTTWVPYTGQVVLLDSNGRLQVRTPVVNDSQFEGPETFSLIARNTGGQQATGVATIRDDGKGDIWTADGSLDATRIKDDDRALSVSSLTVNEASSFAFFTVSGQAGQVLTLKLSHGTAQAADYGPDIEVFNGVTWELYKGQLLQLDADGQLRVRTSLVNDGVFEGPETFSLVAIKTDGQWASGAATIMDDGTGDVLTPDGRPDALAVKDDDRRVPPVIVLPPVVPVAPEVIVSYPLSPERWMPNVGDVEFHKLWDVDLNEGNDRHVPLRFDSALYPVLNLVSVRDIGLTEPVEHDASQRLKSYDWTQSTEQTALLESDSGDAGLAPRLNVAAGMAGELLTQQLARSADGPAAIPELKRHGGDKQANQKVVLPGRHAFSEKLKMAASAKLAERRSMS